MKKYKIEDERILAQRRKIQSRGYYWIVIILLISIIVQQFIMKAPFAQYAVEFFILIGCGLYNVVANYIEGIDIWNPDGSGKRKIFTNALIAGIVSVICLVVFNGKYQISYLLSYFVTFVVFFFSFRLIMIHINNKKQEALDKKLNDDDMTE